MTAADKAAAFAAAAVRMGYADLIATLTAEQGTPFVMTHTGGNCWSIVARMTIGDADDRREVDVYIGDATDPLTPEPQRADYDATHLVKLGFGVVVNLLKYDSEYDEMVPVAMIAEQGSTFATEADVPSMVRMALAEAASGRTWVEL